MRLKYKSTGEEVEVYGFYETGGRMRAVIFDYQEYDKSGNGWKNVGVSKLLPLDVEPRDIQTIARSKVTLWQAFWSTTDGVRWPVLEDAINHEIELMKKESERDE